MDEMRETQVMFEHLDSKLDAIFEYVQDIPEIKERLTRVEGKVDQLQDDMTVVKHVMWEYSGDIVELKARR